MLIKRNAFVIVFALLSSLTAAAQHQHAVKRTDGIEPLPRDLEIELALSSLPAHLRENATVYVLNPEKGFEVGSQGNKWLPRTRRPHGR